MTTKLEENVNLKAARKVPNYGALCDIPVVYRPRLMINVYLSKFDIYEGRKIIFCYTYNNNNIICAIAFCLCF
jgi:hypothetical protein